jgi:hypothetical protein
VNSINGRNENESNRNEAGVRKNYRVRNKYFKDNIHVSIVQFVFITKRQLYIALHDIQLRTRFKHPDGFLTLRERPRNVILGGGASTDRREIGGCAVFNAAWEPFRSSAARLGGAAPATWRPRQASKGVSCHRYTAQEQLR